MYNRGCLLIAGELLAYPDVFDVFIDAFTLIRMLEVDGTEDKILIVDHPDFLEANEGDYLPFYDITLQRVDGQVSVKEIGAPYIHTKYFLQCQNQVEPKKQETQDDPPLIWLPDQM